MKNCDRVPTSVVMFVAIVAGVLFVTSTASGLPLLPQQASAFNKLHHWIKWHEQGAIASIGQENDQNAVCISGSSTIGSCNQSASNFNSGNAVAANVGGGSDSQSSTASISQENDQRAVCISGGDTTDSCNQLGINVNTGNTVAANVR
jgi:hypothetical protein